MTAVTSRNEEAAKAYLFIKKYNPKITQQQVAQMYCATGAGVVSKRAMYPIVRGRAEALGYKGSLPDSYWDAFNGLKEDSVLIKAVNFVSSSSFVHNLQKIRQFTRALKKFSSEEDRLRCLDIIVLGLEK